MRPVLILFMCVAAALTASPQLSLVSVDHAESTAAALRQSLLGEWAGYLEYRDYSEPPTSSKRVQLPTWLNVTQSTAGELSLHYVYDDGPGKIVDETEQLTFDIAHATYTTKQTGHAAEVYRADGFKDLREGRGKLVLTGTGNDNGKPAEQRITLTIRRNLVEWLLEARAGGTAEPFAFRHLYRFTRTQTPAVTPARVP